MMGMVTLELDDEDVEDLTVILQLSNSLTFIMIDRLLGGKGEYKDTDRDFYLDAREAVEYGLADGIIDKL